MASAPIVLALLQLLALALGVPLFVVLRRRALAAERREEEARRQLHAAEALIADQENQLRAALSEPPGAVVLTLRIVEVGGATMDAAPEVKLQLDGRGPRVGTLPLTRPQARALGGLIFREVQVRISPAPGEGGDHG